MVTLASDKTCLSLTFLHFLLPVLESLASGSLVLARDLPVLREISGGIESVDFASSDNEFIKKLENLMNILDNMYKFDILSNKSIERAKLFDKNIVLEKFKNKLLETAKE